MLRDKIEGLQLSSCTLPVPEIMIPRQGEQCLVLIISYMGSSPPKCTCNGNQSHSRKYMILLECLHAQSHVSSPHRLPHTCLSQMRAKIQFSKQKIFVLENTLLSFGKYIGLPSKANCWVILQNSHGSTSELNCWTNSPRQFFGKSSLKFLSQPFSLFFSFSCHALTPIILGCPGAYGMHYSISKQLMLIYFTCIY